MSLSRSITFQQKRIVFNSGVNLLANYVESEETNFLLSLILIPVVILTLKMPRGGEFHPPLDLFVDNFFIVGRIDLKFSVNSYN